MENLIAWEIITVTGVSILGLFWIIIKMRQEFLVKLSDLRRDMEKEHRIIRAHFNDYKLTVARTYTSISMFQEKIKSLKTSPENYLIENIWDESKWIEREACAKLVEEHTAIYLKSPTSTKLVQKIAEAIRNRV